MNTPRCICLVVVAAILCTKYGASALEHESNVIEGETCLTYDFYQNVTAAGCEAKYVNTKACYGQCKSGILSGDRNGNTMMSCKSCWPTKLRTEKVALKCEGNRIENVNVSVVMYCQCTQRRCPTKSGYEKNEVSQEEVMITKALKKLRRRLKNRRRKCKKFDRLTDLKAKERCMLKIKEIKRKIEELKSRKSNSENPRMFFKNVRKRTFIEERQRDPLL